MVDITAIPDRLERRIGETVGQDFWTDSLAKVVIDAVDLVLGHHRVQRAVHFTRRGQVMPNGFSITTRRQCPASSCNSPALPSRPAITSKKRGGSRNRQVRRGIARGHQFANVRERAVPRSVSVLELEHKVQQALPEALRQGFWRDEIPGRSFHTRATAGDLVLQAEAPANVPAGRRGTGSRWPGSACAGSGPRRRRRSP